MADRHNKCKDPSAAVDVALWTAFSATVARVTGLSGAPRTTGGAIDFGSGAFSASLSSARATVVPSQTWTAVAWVRSSVARTVAPQIAPWSAGTIQGSGAVVGSNVALAAGVFTLIRVRGALGSNSMDEASFHLDLPDSGTAGTLTVSSVRLEQVDDAVLEYADGDTSGWVWDGTVGKSTSTFTEVASTLRHNLSTNPSLEVDAVGYSVPFVRSGITATSVGRSDFIDPPAGAGNWYGFTNVTGDGTTSATVSDVDIGLPTATVTAGLAYTFSVAAFHQVTGASVEQYIRWESSTGTNLGTVKGGREALATTGWPRHDITATAPTNTVRAVLQLWLSGITDATTRSFRFDAFLYEQVSAVGTYFDGDTLNATWDGTAHASTSTLDTDPPPASSNARTRGFLTLLG